jgi:hypothetical protein
MYRSVMKRWTQREPGAAKRLNQRAGRENAPDCQLNSLVIEQFHEEELLTRLWMTRQRAVGEAHTVLLLHRVDDATWSRH